MPVILKISAGALIAAILGLLFRRTNPEMTLLLGIVAVCCVLSAAITGLNGLAELIRQVRRLTGDGGECTGPLLKCTAIAVVTRLSADLCRDSGQSALAGAVELAGIACAITVALPVILSILKLLGDLI